MHKHTPDGKNKITDWLNYTIVIIGTVILTTLIYAAFDQTILLKNLDFTNISNSNTGVSQSYLLGEIQNTDVETDESEFLQPGDRLVSVIVINGEKAGEEIVVATSTSDRNFFDDNGQLLIQNGDKVVVLTNETENGDFYNLADNYRLPSTLIVIIGFLLLITVIGRTKGISSFVGLISTLVVLVGFIVPQILDGKNPILISLIGSFAITLISLYLAHGFNKRTSLSVVSTLISIVIATVLALIAVSVTNLFGLGSEEALFIQYAELGNINLKGILLGGIIIGALGVLDDVTTAQTATVEELKKSNQKLGFQELYKRGFSVGQEHISSLVNTLVLAYAGASFPLFILIVSNTQEPLWVILNNEYMIEEIVRTIVGSATLILAVPISTLIAAWWYGRD